MNYKEIAESQRTEWIPENTLAHFYGEQCARAALEKVLEEVAAEPELPGPMPEDMWQMLIRHDVDAVTEACRIIVRKTKQGIDERILAMLADDGP